MLREIINVRQIEGGHRRRWFESDTEDLIVWYTDDGMISGFQLCYDRPRAERALTWLRDAGFSHDRIDDGEGVAMRHKQSPVLEPDGLFDAHAMLNRFRGISERLPGEISDLVTAKLVEYAERGTNT